MLNIFLKLCEQATYVFLQVGHLSLLPRCGPRRGLDGQTPACLGRAGGPETSGVSSIVFLSHCVLAMAIYDTIVSWKIKWMYESSDVILYQLEMSLQSGCDILCIFMK